MTISTQQYAQALYESCQDKNNLDRVILETEEISKNERMVGEYLENSKFSFAEKIKRLQSWEMEKTSINFILLLIKNRNINKLAAIIREIKNLRNKSTNTIEISAQTAGQLSEDEKHTLVAQLQQKTGKNVDFQSEINPEIMGGIIIKIGDILIDNSLKNKLTLLKQELLR